MDAIRSDNGVVPNRCQSVIRANDGLLFWRIYCKYLTVKWTLENKTHATLQSAFSISTSAYGISNNWFYRIKPFTFERLILGIKFNLYHKDFCHKWQSQMHFIECCVCILLIYMLTFGSNSQWFISVSGYSWGRTSDDPLLERTFDTIRPQWRKTRSHLYVIRDYPSYLEVIIYDPTYPPPSPPPPPPP